MTIAAPSPHVISKDDAPNDADDSGRRSRFSGGRGRGTVNEKGTAMNEELLHCKECSHHTPRADAQDVAGQTVCPECTPPRVNQINVPYRHLHDRPVFEVPLIQEGLSCRPRCPVSGYHAFYPAELKKNSLCLVIPSKAAESYLSQRQYARYIGIAVYNDDDN